MNHKPRYSVAEFARRGAQIYAQAIRPTLESDNKGRIVAIDIESSQFEIAEDVLTATSRLFARCPEAQPWIVRIGYPAVHRFGPRITAAKRT